MNINDYGIVPNTENMPGIPARVTAVHKERYEIVCEHGMTYARLKTREFYHENEVFPTTGDFVMIDYVLNGDSRIIATLPRKHTSPDGNRALSPEIRQWRPILTMCSSCSR